MGITSVSQWFCQKGEKALLFWLKRIHVQCPLNNGGQNDPEVAQVISHGSALDPFINLCFQYLG